MKNLFPFIVGAALAYLYMSTRKSATPATAGNTSDAGSATPPIKSTEMSDDECTKLIGEYNQIKTFLMSARLTADAMKERTDRMNQIKAQLIACKRMDAYGNVLGTPVPKPKLPIRRRVTPYAPVKKVQGVDTVVTANAAELV